MHENSYFHSQNVRYDLLNKIRNIFRSLYDTSVHQIVYSHKHCTEVFIECKTSELLRIIVKFDRLQALLDVYGLICTSLRVEYN